MPADLNQFVRLVGTSYCRPSVRRISCYILHFFEHPDDYVYELKNLLTLKFQILHSPLPNSP